MTLSGISNTASMTTLGAAIDRLNSQYTDLQNQTASGVASNTYAGLGSSRYQALSLQPEISNVAAWQQNITTAQSSLGVSQTALNSIATIATNLQTSLTALQSDQSASTISAAATQARQALSQLALLANTQSGDSYVFAGSQQGEAPVTDPDTILSSPMITSIASSVAEVGTTGAAAVESATLAAASDNSAGQSPFSSALSVDGTTASTEARSTIIGSDQRVITGYVITQGGDATSTSTGSPIRDLMRSLAIVASLPSADSSSSGYATLVSDTARSVQGTTTAITQVQSQLGQSQSTLTARGATLSTLSDALNSQLDTAKNVDLTTVSTEVSDVKAQLTASYSLIADMKSMTLASYL